MWLACTHAAGTGTDPCGVCRFVMGARRGRECISGGGGGQGRDAYST